MYTEEPYMTANSCRRGVPVQYLVLQLHLSSQLIVHLCLPAFQLSNCDPLAMVIWIGLKTSSPNSSLVIGPLHMLVQSVCTRSKLLWFNSVLFGTEHMITQLINFTDTSFGCIQLASKRFQSVEQYWWNCPFLSQLSKCMLNLYIWHHHR